MNNSLSSELTAMFNIKVIFITRIIIWTGQVVIKFIGGYFFRRMYIISLFTIDFIIFCLTIPVLYFIYQLPDMYYNNQSVTELVSLLKKEVHQESFYSLQHGSLHHSEPQELQTHKETLNHVLPTRPRLFGL